MSCKDKHGYPINPAPIAPGDCGPCGPHRPPRPPMKPGCPPSQYIGSRYVPIFADPIEWDINKAYESLTIVTYNGESYTSKCNVGPGIDITNERYWAKTGAYNAQVEQCKESVKDLSSQVTGFASDNKEFRDKINGYDKDNAEMKNSVAESKARVDALAERTATAEGEIDALQATTAQHTKDIADLNAKDADLQRQITSNDNDISAIQAKDTTQDGRLDAIDTLNKAQSASIAQNTSDIAKNVKNIQDNAANIAQNAHKIADHAEKLADHEARLTSQHKEITANHEAIAKNTSDIASLRSDLTEDEAKIESNRDAIAHIQEKDVQQDGRLDALEKRSTTAEGRLDGLDTKTDKTNADLTAEVERAKAAEVANGNLIAANAKELANHATELADHEGRITTLETDNVTNKNDISNIIAKNVAQDTAIASAKDSAAHAQETADAAKNAIGDWNTGYPDKTVTEAMTDMSNSINDATEEITGLEKRFQAAEGRLDGLDTKTDKTNEDLTAEITRAKAAEKANADNIAKLETSKADKTEIPDISGLATSASLTAEITRAKAAEAAAQSAADAAQETATAAEGKADANSTTIGSWDANHPGTTISEKVTQNEDNIAAARHVADDADAAIGNWTTDHAGKTISQAVTDANTSIQDNSKLITNLQNGLSTTNETVTGLSSTKANKTDLTAEITRAKAAEKTNADNIAKLETSKADKTDIPDISGLATSASLTAEITRAKKAEAAAQETADTVNIETLPRSSGAPVCLFMTSSSAIRGYIGRLAYKMGQSKKLSTGFFFLSDGTTKITNGFINGSRFANTGGYVNITDPDTMVEITGLKSDELSKVQLGIITGTADVFM